MKCSHADAPVLKIGGVDYADLIPVCRRCGRRLKNETAILNGMGPVCYEKAHRVTRKPLFGSVPDAETNAPV